MEAIRQNKEVLIETNNLAKSYIKKWRSGGYDNFGNYFVDMWNLYKDYINDYIYRLAKKKDFSLFPDYLSESKCIFIDILKGEYLDENRDTLLISYIMKTISNLMSTQSEQLQKGWSIYTTRLIQSFRNFSKEFDPDETKTPIELIDAYNDSKRMSIKMTLDLYYQVISKNIYSRSTPTFIDEIRLNNHTNNKSLEPSPALDDYKMKQIKDEDRNPEEYYFATYDKTLVKSFILECSKTIDHGIFTIKDMLDIFDKCIKMIQQTNTFIPNNPAQAQETIINLLNNNKNKLNKSCQGRIKIISKLLQKQIFNYAKHLNVEPNNISNKKVLKKLTQTKLYQTIQELKNGEFGKFKKRTACFILSKDLLNLYTNDKDIKYKKKAILFVLGIERREQSVYSVKITKKAREYLEKQNIDSASKLSEFITESVKPKTF